MTSVPGGVRGGRRMTGGAGGEASGWMSGLAGCGVGGEGGDARLGHRQLSTRPRPPRLNGSARAVVMGMPDLEVREHTLGGHCGPQRQGPVRLLIKSWRRSSGFVSPHLVNLILPATLMPGVMTNSWLCDLSLNVHSPAMCCRISAAVERLSGST